LRATQAARKRGEINITPVQCHVEESRYASPEKWNVNQQRFMALV
jgi:hypothetical protein